MSNSSRDQAVVLGGGIAGLLAARVLADEYLNVTIIERDHLPTSGEQRRGVPQGRHAHGFLPGGVQVIEELLPGVIDGIVAQGAHAGDILANVRWYLQGRILRQAQTGLTMLSASRPVLEAVIRRRVLALPNVTLLDGHDVVGVAASPDRRRITGVRTTSVAGDMARMLPTDLVVDASGRGSRAPIWLTELGYSAPEGDRVTIDVAYSTRIFDAPPDILGDDMIVVAGRHAGQRRGGVLQRIEGDRLMVTLAGVLGERPPLALEEFLAYAQTLSTSDIHEAIRTLPPVGEAASFRCPTYVRHRYERLKDLPSGLLVLGDAVCALNPLYAHGMSVAAMNAMTLRKELCLGDEPDPREFFAKLSPTLDQPWFLAVGADLAIPGATGPALPPSPTTGEYLLQLQRAAAQDADVATSLVRVNALMDPPSALLAPEIVDRVRGLGEVLVGR
jgi:2-polyprenyl-6-methoxyphenol hydroxylase-like FAD-dependent oxidoreductase